MQIYNTMSRKKEELIPLIEGQVRIYVCGPTVYNFIHVGNARPLCVFDTMRRYLTYRGYDVLFVSNVTDIDDKLITKANDLGKSVKEVAEEFEREYLHDADGLQVLRPNIMPRATEHMTEIITLIQDIIERGYGYCAENGDVYFRARKFPEYGKLSHKVLDDLENNRDLRSEMKDDLKEEASDFAVWKAAKPGEPAWESPFGSGRPGWHIECSAMAKKHLGATFDIHAGGQDLIFPHHENEIAQSECANGETFARYWMHNGFLNIDDRKMSKSLGNFFTVRQVADEMGYEPIRYFMLSAHYRSPVNFTMDILQQCKASLDRLYTCRENLAFVLEKAKEAGDSLLLESAQNYEKRFCEKMDDDLNTADALAVIFDFVRDINTNANKTNKESLQKVADIFDSLCAVLGILCQRKEEAVPSEVVQLAEQRAQARKDKNWPLADELRSQIDTLGYLVEDTSTGPKLTKKM